MELKKRMCGRFQFLKAKISPKGVIDPKIGESKDRPVNGRSATAE